MNCPKCGKELLIGSDVCPVCDIGEQQKKEKNKTKIKLTKFGKIIIGILFLAVLLSAIACVALNIGRHAVISAENGNYLNGGLAVKNGKYYYYSTEKTLYCTDKRFAAGEEIDNGNSIGNIVSLGKCIYYTKDGRVYQYNPKIRKIKPMCALVGNVSVAGFSDRFIFYNEEDGLYRLSLSDMSYEKFAYGKGVFDRGRLYLVENSELFKINPKTYERKKIASLETYTAPAFVKSGRVFCFEQSKQKLISVGIQDGDITEEFNTADYENISDVEHVNLYEDYLLLRGENGVYRFDRDTKEAALLYSVGYIKSTIVMDGSLYIYLPDGTAHFADINGNIKHSMAAVAQD